MGMNFDANLHNQQGPSMAQQYRNILCAALILAPSVNSFAQAQFGSESYGQISVGINYITNQTGGGSVTNITTDQVESSFLGFRGREDLGGGISAVYRLESDVNPTSGNLGKTVAGTNLPFNRFATVGLAGENIGTVTVGRQWLSMVDLVVFQLDTFNVAGPGAYTVPLALTGTNRYVGYDSSASNSIKYRYGTSKGLQLSASYGFGGVAGSQSKGADYSASAVYSGSNYNLGLGYVRYNSPTAIAGTDTVPNQTAWAVGGNMTFGSLKPYLAYYSSTSNSLKAGTNAQIDKILALGLRWEMAPFVIRGAYYTDKGTTLDSVNGRDGSKNSIILASEYWLSKRTNVYVAFSNNSLSGGYMLEPVFTGALNRNPTASSVQLYSVGMSHSF